MFGDHVQVDSLATDPLRKPLLRSLSCII